MLAAGNAAGMSTRDSSANHSDLETQHEAVKVSNPNSDISNPPPPPQTVSRKSRRTRSMDFKRVVRSLERSASGELKGVLLHDTQTQKKIFRGTISYVYWAFVTRSVPLMLRCDWWLKRSGCQIFQGMMVYSPWQPFWSTRWYSLSDGCDL